ncbi:MAG TPA: hypothetical protein VD997_03165 [Phycisphaerales bacterium]|nr:hypothetical protein [Phycisphaerales bacterium]
MNPPFVPRSIRELVEMAGAILPVWTSNAVAVGLSASQCTEMASALTKTSDKIKAADTARNASKAATLDMKDSAAELRTLVQQAVDRIRLFALSSSDPNAVFVLSQVPPPSGPTPMPPPEAPTDVSADPNADGTATISWKGSLAGGAFFTVWRKVGEAGAWTQIGAVAAKKFMDFSVPNPGTTQGATLFYGVRTQRNVEVSPMSVTATITYGSGPGFTAFGSEFSAQGGKLAA